MAIFLAPAALNFGDLIVVLPVVRSLLEQGHETFLVLRSMQHSSIASRIPGINGFVMEWELEDVIGSDDRLIDLRDHDLQREFWWGSKPFIDKYPHLKIDDILNTICGDKGLAVDFASLLPLNHAPTSELDRAIVFVPGSAVAAKEWPAEKWRWLYEQLESTSWTPVIIGQPELSPVVANLIDRGCRWYETPELCDALDVVSSCAAVVSVDTGLMHLAVNQFIPTIGIFRHAPVYARHHAHFRSLIASRQCHTACYEAELRVAHHNQPTAGPQFNPGNWQCQSHVEHCLDTIAPQRVLLHLIDLLAVTNRRGYRSQQTSSRQLPVLP